MKIIAHRGASGEFPENTLLAFEQAIAQGADAIEFDVHFHHPSQQYVVFHDRFLDPKSSGSGKVTDCSTMQLHNATMGEGQAIPTLEQAITAIDGRVDINIELKSTTTSEQALAEELCILQKNITDTCNACSMKLDQIILSSFNHILLQQLPVYLPQFKYAALIAHIPQNLQPYIGHLNCEQINIDINCYCRTLVAAAKKYDLKVGVYTVDRAQDITQCLSDGVDAIFTNYPQKTREYIASNPTQ